MTKRDFQRDDRERDAIAVAREKRERQLETTPLDTTPLCADCGYTGPYIDKCPKCGA